LLKVIFADSFT